MGFSGKYAGWEEYQYPDYKGLGRSKQLNIVKRAIGGKFVHYSPNTFKMNDSLNYHNRHKFILSPRSGHIWHPRLSIAARVQTIPIIIIPDNCPEMRWFPELKHGKNCFILKDSEIPKIAGCLKRGTVEMAAEVQKLETYHNFYVSMQEIEGKLIAMAT